MRLRILKVSKLRQIILQLILRIFLLNVKETFEYFVNDPNNFCSVHDALEMDTSMPCPCWEGSKVPVNEKGEEESIPWVIVKCLLLIQVIL